MYKEENEEKCNHCCKELIMEAIQMHRCKKDNIQKKNIECLI